MCRIYCVRKGTLIQLSDSLITSTRNFHVSHIEINCFSTVHLPFEKWRQPTFQSPWLEKEMVSSTLCKPLHEWIHASRPAAVDSQVTTFSWCLNITFPTPCRCERTVVPPGSLQPTYSWIMSVITVTEPILKSQHPEMILLVPEL